MISTYAFRLETYFGQGQQADLSPANADEVQKILECVFAASEVGDAIDVNIGESRNRELL